MVHVINPWYQTHRANITTVSEVIALKLRSPGTAHPYIGPQVLAGTAYLVAAGIMLELWRVHRRKVGKAAGVDVEEGAREVTTEEGVLGDEEKGENVKGAKT